MCFVSMCVCVHSCVSACVGIGEGRCVLVGGGGDSRYVVCVGR